RTSTSSSYARSLHDALPICRRATDQAMEVAAVGEESAACDPLVRIGKHARERLRNTSGNERLDVGSLRKIAVLDRSAALSSTAIDRKSTRLNSSHSQISYAV